MRMLNTGNKIFGSVSTATLFEKDVHTILKCNPERPKGVKPPVKFGHTPSRPLPPVLLIPLRSLPFWTASTSPSKPLSVQSSLPGDLFFRGLSKTSPGLLFSQVPPSPAHPRPFQALAPGTRVCPSKRQHPCTRVSENPAEGVCPPPLRRDVLR